MRRDFLNGQLPALLMTRQPSVSLGTVNPRFGLLKISRCQRDLHAVLPCGPHHRSVGFTDALPCGVGSHSTHVVKTPQHSNQQRSTCAKHLSSPRLLLAVHKNMVSVVIDVPLDLLSAVALQLSIRFFEVSTTVEVALVPQRSPVTQLRNAQCGCLSLCALGNPAANSLVWSAATASAQASASLSLSLCQAKECQWGLASRSQRAMRLKLSLPGHTKVNAGLAMTKAGHSQLECHHPTARSGMSLGLEARNQNLRTLFASSTVATTEEVCLQIAS